MSFRPDRYRELRSFLRRDVGEDVTEELAQHLEMAIADGVAAGLSEAQAREEALRRFGDVVRWRDETVAIEAQARREGRRMEVVSSIIRDARYGARTLLRMPGFTVVALLTLALGIGAPAAIYTLIDSIVLRPLPYPSEERLVQVDHPAPGVGADQVWGTSVAQYFYYFDRQRSFEKLGGYSTGTVALSEGEAERVEAGNVTAAVLDVLGAPMLIGRRFTEADDDPGAAPVVVLGYGLWATRFGADAGILNREIRIDGMPHTVVGVTAPGFTLPGEATQLWLPLHLDRTAPAANYHWLRVYGLLRPGTTAAAASAELDRYMHELPAHFPNAYSERFFRGTGFYPRVVSVRTELLGSIDRTLWILLGSVLLVLLIAAGNVANLFLVRSESRRRETALRSSLGAERVHLALQYITEALLLSLAAAALGLLLAWGATRLLVALAPAGLPRLDEVALSWRVAVFALGLGAVAGIIFGLFPVLRAGVSYDALREGGRGLTASRGQHRVRNGLVVAQMGMALVLLAAGALLVQSYLNLRSVDAGIEPEGVLTFQIAIPDNRYQDHLDAQRFYHELSGRLAALPGVEAVGGTVALPFGGDDGCAHTVIEAAGGVEGDQACVPTPQVLPGYFETLGIPVRGRTFDWGMLQRREGVAVISRALAERFFPGEDPIGRGIISYRDGPPWYRIIGVAEDVRSAGYDKPPVEAIYYPQTPMDIQGTWWTVNALTMTVKTSLAKPASLTGSIRQVVAELDPEVPIANVATMGEVIRRSPGVARASFALLLLAFAAGMALFLSAVGLYGVISFLVAQRRGEIAVRMALGAHAAEVRTMVLRQSLVVVLLGVVIGVPAALLANQALRSLLFGVSAGDPGTLVLVTLLLLGVATAASYIPALRAAALEPMRVLRED